LVSRAYKLGSCTSSPSPSPSLSSYSLLLSRPTLPRSQLQSDLMQKWDLPEARRPCDDDFLDSSSDSDEDSGLKNSAVASVEEDEEVDNGEVTLTIALQVLIPLSLPLSLTHPSCSLCQVIDRFGGRQSNPSLPMDDLMKTLFRDAIDYIGRFVSERGMQGECLFAKQEGYEILFRPMNKHMITDFKVAPLLPSPLLSSHSSLLSSPHSSHSSLLH
jgi:hypothetical protein